MPREGVSGSMSIPPARRHRVLLVDDEEDTRKALAGWLAYDYEVVAAADGLAALEIATREGTVPDVVVADVWMPGLDGFEMVKRMTQNALLRHVPVIFLTGQTSPRSVVTGIAAGARAYLTKPIDLDVLDRKLRSALCYRAVATEEDPWSLRE
jgi:CheY-like chemotaxis protein